MDTKDIEAHPATPKALSGASASSASTTSTTSAHVGRAHLATVIAPHATYEGAHRFSPSATWTAAEEAAVVRKCDARLLSWLCVMFFALQLDRGNLGNATADDLLADLGLTTDDYNNGSTIQLLGFLAAEFPVQILTKRYGFRLVLPAMMMCWGTVSWAQAWMTGRTGFYVTRALIGVCEGGFIPGTVLFATYFYTSKELAIRLAAFWSTLNVARIISALLAAGILEMRGVQGKPGWFWLFLLEGLLTCVIALISFLYLPTSPTATKSALFRKGWFSEREEVIMVNRILRDDPAKGLTAIQDPVTWTDMTRTWKDPAMLGLYLVGLVAYIPATPVSSYLTLTLKRLDFSTFAANMLTIPAAVIQIITMLTLAWSSDRRNERALHAFFGEFWILPLLVAAVALPDGGREWGRFSLVSLVSGYPYFHPIISSWISENSFDVKKRAITAATYNVVVQVGSLVGSQIYRSWDGPYYHVGNSVLLAICVLSLVAIAGQRQVLVRLNKRKEQRWGVMSAEERTAYQSDTVAREKEGNKRLDFRFVY